MATVETWIRGEAEPSGPYELLGLRQFCPACSEVKSAIRLAARELSQYQIHEDPETAGRASHFLSEIGKADVIWSNEDRLLAFHIQLFESLRRRLHEQVPSLGDVDKAAAWLVTEQLVDRRTARSLADALLKTNADVSAIVSTLLGLKSQTCDASAVETHGGELAKTNGPPQDQAALGRDVETHSEQVAAKNSSRRSGGLGRQRKRSGTGVPQNRPAAKGDVSLVPLEAVPLEAVPESLSRRRFPQWVWIVGTCVIVIILLADLLWFAGVFNTTEPARPVMSSNADNHGLPSDSGKGGEYVPPADRTKAPQPDLATTQNASVELAENRQRAVVEKNGLNDETKRTGGLLVPGTEVELTGTLHAIVGQRTDPPNVTLVIQSDESAQYGQNIEALTEDVTFADELLDYVTAMEQQYDFEQQVPGDAVRLRGVVISHEEHKRLGWVNQNATPIRLEWIERIGDSSSKAVVRGVKRKPDSFRTPLAELRLRGLMRMPPNVKDQATFVGIYRSFDEEYRTVFIAPRNGLRGVEVQVANQPEGIRLGQTVTATGTFFGERMTRRRANGVVNRRWILANGSVRSNDAAATAARSVESVKPRAGFSYHLYAGTDLLVGTEDNQTAIYHNQKWYTLNLARKSPNFVQWALVDRSERCWIAGSGGVSRLDGKTVKSFTSADGLPTKMLSHLFEDSQGRVWVSSHGNGVAVLESGKWRRYGGTGQLTELDMNGCVEDALGRIWTGGTPNLFVLSDEQASQQATGNFMSLDVDQKGRVYLGFIGGMLQIDGRTTRQISADDLPQRTPQATFVDSKGRIWLGTWGGGVVRVEPDAALRITPRDALVGKYHVCRICERADGAIIAGTLEGLWVFDGMRWIHEETPQSLQQFRCVATIPENIAAQLISWGNGQPEQVQRTRRRPTSSQKKSRTGRTEITVNSPVTRRKVTIRKGSERQFVDNVLGEPIFSLLVSVAAEKQKITVFRIATSQSKVLVLLLVFNAADEVQFMDYELNLPSTNATAQSNAAQDMLATWQSETD